MKERFGNINSRKWTRIILVSVFFLILGCSLAGEKVAKDNGIGWDGEIYLNTIQHFTELILTHGYDRYAIQRIMPWGLVNIVFQICHIEATPHNALIAGGVLNILALALAIFYFFRISSLKQWKQSTEVIAFASLFYSYALLKIPGYYILLSDTFGFLWGIMMLYYFLCKKRWALIFLAVLGSVNWPVALLCGLVLAFFPTNEMRIHSILSREDSWIYNVILCGLSLSPFLFQIAVYIGTKNHVFIPWGFDGGPVSMWVFVLSIICVCGYLYYMIRPFKFSISQIWSECNSIKTWINITCAVCCFIGVNILLHCLTNGNDGALNNRGLVVCVYTSCLADPLCFIESFFVYFGPVVLLTILLWQKSAQNVANKGMGYFFVIALSVFFSIRPEARVSIMYLPFIALPIMEYIDTYELKRWVPRIYMLLCIILSHCWLPINTDGMEFALSWENFEHYNSFPAQRYFMFTGHWQSHEMYYICMAITVIVGIILYIGIRKKWFIIREDNR